MLDDFNDIWDDEDDFAYIWDKPQIMTNPAMPSHKMQQAQPAAYNPMAPNIVSAQATATNPLIDAGKRINEFGEGLRRGWWKAEDWLEDAGRKIWEAQKIKIPEGLEPVNQSFYESGRNLLRTFKETGLYDMIGDALSQPSAFGESVKPKDEHDVLGVGLKLVQDIGRGIEGLSQMAPDIAYQILGSEEPAGTAAEIGMQFLRYAPDKAEDLIRATALGDQAAIQRLADDPVGNMLALGIGMGGIYHIRHPKIKLPQPESAHIAELRAVRESIKETIPISTKAAIESEIDIGFMGTPEVYKQLGQTIIKGFDYTHRAVSSVIDKAKIELGPSKIGVKDAKESMIEHHRNIREAEYVTKELTDQANDVTKDWEPARKVLLIDALEQPGKYLNQLTSKELPIYHWAKRIGDEISKFATENQLIDIEKMIGHPTVTQQYMLTPFKERYIKHWWKNPYTGEAYRGMFGKFSKKAPEMLEREYPTYESGRAAGLKMATDNIGTILGRNLESLTRANESRNMFAHLSQIESGNGIAPRAEVQPMMMIENWNELSEKGLTNGYVRYNHELLDRKFTFKDKDRKERTIQGPIGVKEELYPFLKAYVENPTYGRASEMVFAAKNIKLMGPFHIWSLAWQDAAAGRFTPVSLWRGNKFLREKPSELKELFKEGLELHGYIDVGYLSEPSKTIIGQKSKAARAITTLSRPVTNLIFNVIHPKIKSNMAVTQFRRLITDFEKKYNAPPSEQMRSKLARDAVQFTDRLFSGEDYKRALLETNEFMAKYWYSPEARKILQLSLISPTWQKAHFSMAKEVIKGFSLDTKSPMAKHYRRYGYRALLGIYGSANLMNWAITKMMDGEGKMMFANEGYPEWWGGSSNSFSIRLPWNYNGRKVFFRPLKSIFEVPEYILDFFHKTGNKLNPWIDATRQVIKPAFVDRDKNILEIMWNWTNDVLIPISVESSMIQQNRSWGERVFNLMGMPTSKSPKTKRYRY